MTHSTSSSAAAARIAYAASRRGGFDPEQIRNEAFASISRECSDHIEATASHLSDRQTELARIAQELIQDVESVRAYDFTTNHIEQLRNRVASLEAHEKSLSATLQSAEDQLNRNTLKTSALVDNLSELRRARMHLLSLATTKDQIITIGGQLCIEAARQNREI